MKNNVLALLLACFATVSFAQNTNPFRPAQAAKPVAMTPASLAGVPQGPGGAPVGPDGRRPMPQAASVQAGQPLPSVVPPFPGSSMLTGAVPSESRPEVRVRYVGKVNGQNVYRADAQYYFDKKKRPDAELVEDPTAPLPLAAPAAPAPSATPASAKPAR